MVAGEPSFNLHLNVCALGGIFFARAGDELFTSADLVLDGRQGLRENSLASLAVCGETRDDLEVVKSDESFQRVALAEFTLQDFGIGIADAKGMRGGMESHLRQWNLPNEMRL